jgi:3-isopropylmalate/(R)-2-methylmalate dehydratase small subunit
MKQFAGSVLFLDRSDINTDEIIPAKYLTEISKQALRPHLLEDLDLKGFDPQRDIPGTSVIVTRKNFGCGSSREHAPWALEVNEIYTVIAENFARIFRQNMYNCGMLAVELPKEQIDSLFSRFQGKPTSAEADVEQKQLTFSSGDETLTIPFSISEFDLALIRAGGWVEYADMYY